MSCSDSKKSKKRKSNKSGNMGDVLGKECGDGEKDKLQEGTCEENVREEADGAPSGDEQSSQSSGEMESYEVKQVDEVKGDTGQTEENVAMSVIPLAAGQREEKPCNCDACKDRREVAAEQLEEMRRLQSYWMELRQYIRMVYRMAMEGRTTENGGTDSYEAKMKELVHKLCARDPHQLFQRLESQVQEFVIEAKVRQLELLHREQQTPELAQIFLTGLLEGFDKLCLAAKQLAPLLQQLETEHLQRFNLTWEVLNKHLYQSCVYTDPLVQNNLPHYIGQLRNMLPGKNEAYSELVHHYLAFDDEMTLIGAMWRDTETLVHEYNQEQATLKAKQRMLREDWELFKAQRKLIQQKMWNKTASELREFDEQLMNLASMAGPGPDSPRDGSPEEGSNANAGFCLGCSSRRGCPCDECAMTHLLTCGGLITPPDSPSPLYSHKVDVVREYRVEGEGSEQPPSSPSEPEGVGDNGLNGGDVEVIELPANQQQSCECHVCTAPIMSPMDLMESYECHTCVQQGVPLPGSSSAVNLNLHAGGFHLYPHIHGTGGGGDAGSLYPHLYNIHPSLLTQLGTKHSRLGVHLQDQIQLTSSDPKSQHLISPPTSVSDLLPPGLTLEALPISTSPCMSTVASTAASFSSPAPIRPNPAPSPSSPSSAAKSPVGVGLQQKQAPSPPIPAKGGGQCKSPAQNLQSSASTQTSPSKAKVGVNPPHGVVRQLPQTLVKRVSAGSQQQGVAVMNGHHHPVVSRSSPNLNSSSVRHSMTQTANSTTAGHSHTHPHPLLPDVVKSAATSTTPHRPPSKVPAHSCHKSLKNGGSMEPIKRVACTDYPDSEVVDLEDSSSQDDTCSERSSSTTTSTQRDSRHCDCCYCEVFGHGMPSVAPVSRNYQEMRERLRLLLTKKKAKCKIGPGPGSAPQSVVGPQTGTAEVAAAKPTVPVATPSPATVTVATPVLAKQDSADSLLQPTKDPRDLEALLDFIEGNQTGRCKDAKKAAKKARQKQKKMEEKEKKDLEEAERLRGLEELQTNTPEVTITVVNTPGASSVVASPCPSQSSSKMGKSGKRVEPVASPVLTPDTNGKAASAPQMVTIKRVMESNGAEPTVTITLKGATPDKDKVLFTLVNGQVCQSQEESKTTNQHQPIPPQGSKNNSNNCVNNSTNGKKKKSKGGNGSQQNNSNSATTTNKSQHSTVKSTVKLCIGPSAVSSKPIAVLSKPTPAPPVLTQAPTPRTGRPASSVLDSVKGTTRSFSLENLKLPPGITITKVDGPMAAAAAAQRKAQLKAAENPKPPSGGSATIIATPTNVGNPNRLSGFGQAVNGSNVIVVDTGRMKEELESSIVPAKDYSEDNNNQNPGGNGKKKNKKKNKTGSQENGSSTANGNGNGSVNNKTQQRQQQVVNGSQMNGKQQNHIGSKGQSLPNSGNVRLQPPQQSTKVNGRPMVQPAIIKMNGSMVTIRNPALQQAMVASGTRFSQPTMPQMNGQSEVQVNGSVKPGKKTPPCPPALASGAGMKGKENSSMLPGTALRNGLNGPHTSRPAVVGGRGDEGRVTTRVPASLPPRMRPLQQQAALQHPTAARAMMQAREAMAAANDAKKKKKKKKCPGSQGHADDWTLVEW